MANVVLHPWPNELTDLHLYYTQAVSSTPGLVLLFLSPQVSSWFLIWTNVNSKWSCANFSCRHVSKYLFTPIGHQKRINKVQLGEPLCLLGSLPGHRWGLAYRGMCVWNQYSCIVTASHSITDRWPYRSGILKSPLLVTLHFLGILKSSKVTCTCKRTR